MSVLLSGIGAIRKEQLISSCSNGERIGLLFQQKGKAQKRRRNLLVKLENWHDEQLRQQIRQSQNIFPDRFLVYGQNIYQMLHLIESNYMNRLKIL